MEGRELDEKKLQKYFAVTKAALDCLQHIQPTKTHLDTIARDYLDMATRYYLDAHHFKEKGDWITAFAALNYAHGWLDAGARLGLWEVGHNSTLFTVD
ncbi:DUF357 domain-containing protein [Candidatus Woesearchaeota archaeon]|nr:DUF357 domain-containing protein [Nanoarchaeota archaeon]MCB9370166.1 DUF357 domain-containing protein [Candidatus Woesearchaeota archaeon]USN44696.1 MAG: DUF357 domain-containing protein [Candidatus Woesearchaeota archaeon]